VTIPENEIEVSPDVVRSGRFDRTESDRTESQFSILHQNCYWVYILQSIPFPEHFYTGFSSDIPERIKVHNRKAPYYSKRFAPWKLRAQSGFPDKSQAMAFERYLKTGSGRAFAKKHF
jgi:putative endonuclease